MKVRLLTVRFAPSGKPTTVPTFTADPRTSAIPIVVFSSSYEKRDLEQARELGAHSYVVKPVDFGQFAEAVREALAGTNAMDRTIANAATNEAA